MKKVVHIVTDIGLISETFIAETMKMISESSLEYHVIYQSNHSGEFLKNITYHQEDFAILTNPADRLKYRIRNSEDKTSVLIDQGQKKITNILKRLSPDVVFVDFGVTSIYALEGCVKLNTPLIVHLHGADITSRITNKSYADRLLKVFNHATYVVTASEHIKRLTVLFGCAEEKIKVIRYGLDFDRIDRLNSKVRTPYPSLIFLGRMTEKKHPLAIIHMFHKVHQEIPDARLTLIGGGELEEKVKQRIKILNLENVIDMKGPVPNEEALKIMSLHWLYVQHSVTASTGDQEGFGISLAEAAAMEIPVVSTWHNGIPEQVMHNQTGLLCQEFDYETMANQVIRLLQNEELRTSFGIAARKNIISLCDRNKRKEQLIKLFHD